MTMPLAHRARPAHAAWRVAAIVLAASAPACSAILGFNAGSLEVVDAGDGSAGDAPTAGEGAPPPDGPGAPEASGSSSGPAASSGGGSSSGAGEGGSSGGPVKVIAAGGDDTCALVSGGVECWGDNSLGQVSYGSGVADAGPPSPPTLLGKVPSGSLTALSVGGDHACAAMPGQILCWGDNSVGQLGNGSQAPLAAPFPLPFGGSMTALAAGYQHTCATQTGMVVCWGNDVSGDLGESGPAGPWPNPRPLQPAGSLETSVVALSAGREHTCGVAMEGPVSCWGSNQYGQLGNGSTTDSAVPVAAMAPTGGLTQIAAGAYHTCAILGAVDGSPGMVFCWGRNDAQQLGVTAAGMSPAPVMPSFVPAASAIAAGDAFTCAIVQNGQVLCWGDNSFGQLGMPGAGGISYGKPIPQGAIGIAAGANHACAAMNDGSVMCWGSDSAGQLGVAPTSLTTQCVDAGVAAPCAPTPVRAGL